MQVSSTCGAVLGANLGMQPFIRKSIKVSCLQFRDVGFSALHKCCGVQTKFGPIDGQLGFDSMTSMPSIVVTVLDFVPHVMESIFCVTLFCKDCDSVPFSWQILIK